MRIFDFEENTKDYSSQNAYWLGRASQVAYKQPEEARSELASWGLDEFRYFDRLNTQAFIAGNSKILLLAFRGTENLRDWMTDMNIKLIDELGGKVHKGFLYGLEDVWGDIWKIIRTQRKQRPLWITGHSLGAALATLAVARLREKGEPVSGLYTFGSPRVGDHKFAKKFNADFSSQTFRYVNNNDVVARVPFLGYCHVGTFKYFDENGNQRDGISWWNLLQDRIKGRIKDLFEPGTDGIKDHSITNYVICLNKATIKI